jgi:Beta xylosidase C-terminal Concanavalin A-like domain
VPGIRVGNGLRLAGAGKRVDAGVLARRVRTPRYVATAAIDRRSLRGEAVAGIASYRSGFTRIGGSGFDALGAAVGRRRLIVWRRARGKLKLVTEVRPPSSRFVHLGLSARGRRVRFRVSRDGRRWRSLGPEVRTSIEESARLVLTVGGRRRAVARFARASLKER